MHRPLTLLRLALTTAALLCVSSSAQGQGWLSDRDQTEGDGIKLGAFELHPGIGSEGGYNTNVFLGDVGQDSGVLRVTPHLYLQSSKGGIDLEARDLNFRTGVSSSLIHYFATEANTDVSLKQDAKLEVRLSRIVSVSLEERLQRSIDPFSDAIAPNAGNEPVDTDRLQLNVGGRLGLNSPGGLLKGGVGYTLGIDHFEGDVFAANRNQSHTVTADSSYQFLPKTAFFWNSGLRFHRYVNKDIRDVAERNDSTNVNSRVGINGGLTPRLGFTLSAGYAAGFFEDDNDYESVIAQIQARWRTSQTTALTLAYERAFNSAFQGNFARTDRFKAQGQALFGGVFMLRASAELTMVDFGRDDLLSDDRNDIHLLTGLSGEYRFTDWFALTAEVGYLQNFTDFTFTFDDDADPNTPEVVDEAKYNRFSAWLGVRAFL